MNGKLNYTKNNFTYMKSLLNSINSFLFILVALVYRLYNIIKIYFLISKLFKKCKSFFNEKRFISFKILRSAYSDFIFFIHSFF